MKLITASIAFVFLCQASSALADSDADSYATNAENAIKTMNNKWYDANTGLWNKLWWNSANVLTAITALGAADGSFKSTAANLASTTYAKAPSQNSNGWTNGFYDDEGWWALAWISTYDLTGDAKYLQTAQSIFEDMTGGWNTNCNGGLWWDKKKTYISAISNELFLSVAAHLANRVPSEKSNYIHWAQMEWDWFSKIGVINAQNTINDGINNDTCKNNGATVFTYNQGVILGGLAELTRVTGDSKYVNEANTIAQAAMKALSDSNGILTESGGINEDDNLAQFKGVFVRNLATLNKQASNSAYTSFLKKNADTIWSKDKDGSGLLGPHWQGPLGTVSAPSHSSALDAIVAAMLVA